MNERLISLTVGNAIDEALALPKGASGDFIEGFVWGRLLHELSGMHSDSSVMISDNTLFVAIQWEPLMEFLLYEFDIVTSDTPHVTPTGHGLKLIK